MNILTDEQAAARQLTIPVTNMVQDLPPDFLADLQLRGAFMEYNQQAIVSAGATFDYVACVVTGRATVSQIDSNYAKVPLGTLEPGRWFGELNLFLRHPATEEVFADGEVIIWTMPPDTLRRIFLEERAGVQLLYNIAGQMAQKLITRSAKPRAAVSAE